MIFPPRPTNILKVDFAALGWSAADLVAKWKARGVLCNPRPPHGARLVGESARGARGRQVRGGGDPGNDRVGGYLARLSSISQCLWLGVLAAALGAGGCQRRCAEKCGWLVEVQQSSAGGDEPVLITARAQSGRVVPLGRGSTGAGQGRGQADLFCRSAIRPAIGATSWSGWSLPIPRSPRR